VTRRELSDVVGTAVPRAGAWPIRAPLSRRRCVDYHLSATYEERSARGRLAQTERVYEDAAFVPWTLRGAGSDGDEAAMRAALSEHGDGDGGFAVWEPLAAALEDGGVRRWATSSYDRSSLAQDLGELALYAAHLLSALRARSRRPRIPFESLGFVTRRRFAGAGLAEHVRRAHQRLARGEIREFRYELVERAVIPGERVRLAAARAVTRPGLSPRGAYRQADVQRGLVRADPAGPVEGPGPPG
jgi:hypothetical protein